MSYRKVKTLKLSYRTEPVSCNIHVHVFNYVQEIYTSLANFLPIRIGSDEDDEDADESQSADDPSDTAVSHLMECAMEQDGTVDQEGDDTQDDNDDDQGARSDSNTPQKDMPTPVKDTPTSAKDTPTKEPAVSPQVNGHVRHCLCNQYY